MQNILICKQSLLECIKNKDDVVSLFGRKPNVNNADNFNLISSRPTDNILRFSSSISKSVQGMANSVKYNILGFDCFSFSRRTPVETNFGRLEALDGLYFDTLTPYTKLVCVLTRESLYRASQKFRKNQKFAYLPIYIHDIVRLNELLEELHVIYNRRQLVVLFEDRNP